MTGFVLISTIHERYRAIISTVGLSSFEKKKKSYRKRNELRLWYEPFQGFRLRDKILSLKIFLLWASFGGWWFSHL